MTTEEDAQTSKINSLKDDSRAAEESGSGCLEDESPSSESTVSSLEKESESGLSVSNEAKNKKRKSAEAKNSSDTKNKPSVKKPVQKKRVVATKKSIGELRRVLNDFLTTKSRPYTLTEIVVTFKSEGSKPDILKVLNEMVENGKLIQKDYNKKQVYLCTKQHSNMSEAQIDEIKKKCEAVKIRNCNLKEEMEKIKNKIQELCKYPKDDDLKEFIKEKLEKIEENKKRYSDFEAGNIEIDKEDMVKVDKVIQKHKKILKERNLAFKTAFDVLLDNSGMKKSDFIEEVGFDEE